MRKLNDAQYRRTPNIQSILAGPAVRNLPILYHEEDRYPIDGGIYREGGQKDEGSPPRKTVSVAYSYFIPGAIASYQRTINGNSEERGQGMNEASPNCYGALLSLQRGKGGLDIRNGKLGVRTE